MKIDKNNIYLPKNPTVSDFSLSLETIDELDKKTMQHIAIESISSDPLYMAMGYTVAITSDGFLSEWKPMFEEFLLNMQTTECRLDSLSMANFILQTNKIYLDVSEQYWGSAFVFNRYNMVKDIEYLSQIVNSTTRPCKLELFQKDNVIYSTRNEWLINNKTGKKTHTECEHTYYDMNVTDSLYAYLMYHCSTSSDIDRFKLFFQSVNIDTVALGKFWLHRWLMTEVKLLTPRLLNIKMQNDRLVSICSLIEADVCLIQKHVDLIKSLNILNCSNIDTYAQLLYESGRNKVSNIESGQPIDFDIIS